LDIDWIGTMTGTQDRCAQVIQSLGLVVVEYKDSLLKTSTRRRGISTLSEFVDWVVLVS
jgi:hypothetical protein